MKDLTVIMLTPNLVPKKWAEFHKEKLMEAIGDTPLITVSKKPMDWGINLIQKDYGIVNIYKQMLRATKIANTEWIAMADDDTLYPKQHFEYRPKQKGFFYNLNRWHLFTWGEPIYFYKAWRGNGLFIGSRDLTVNALKKRFSQGEDLPRKMYHELGTRKDMLNIDGIEGKGFFTNEPILSFYHEYSFDEDQKQHRKKMHPVRAYDIPIWGRAEDIRKKFI